MHIAITTPIASALKNIYALSIIEVPTGIEAAGLNSETTVRLFQ
jgi:hypothetical protein